MGEAWGIEGKAQEFEKADDLYEEESPDWQLDSQGPARMLWEGGGALEM